jgi:predicted N-acetyltransferase YhbS
MRRNMSVGMTVGKIAVSLGRAAQAQYQPPHPGLMTDMYHPDSAYVAWVHGRNDTVTFDVYARRAPFDGSYLLFAGLETALHFVRDFRFTDEDVRFLAQIRDYDRGYLDELRNFRFSGEIMAMPEGSIAFPNEPLLRVTGPFREALLAEVEARLAARGAQTVRFFADAPHYLRPGVDFRDTAFVSFLERRRYAPRRAVCNMAADLAAARLDTAADEARLGADGFEIRRLAQADAAAFEEYMLERWTPSWRTEAMRSLRREPVSSHVALREGRIVGFASHSVSGPGQFGPMGTNQELRGQGVGAVLLKRCLADQREAGFAECDIQWVGPKGFYADHVGARISRCFWQYERGLMVDA